MREVVHIALREVAGRFSNDAPSIDGAALQSRYSALEAWPADGQLGLYILAWVLGPGFSLKGFKESVNVLVPDFARAASAVSLKDDPSLFTVAGIARQSLRNAAVITECDLNPDVLYWPLDLASCTL